MKVSSLFPIPGSKRAKKYAFLQPLPHQTHICEAFAGGAAVSLRTGLSAVLGEVNSSLRAIALAPTTESKSQEYIRQYAETVRYFLDGVDTELLFSYCHQETAMKYLRLTQPDLCAILDERWRTIVKQLFSGVANGEPMPGLYSFCQRACFGNVMRLNSTGTHFNVTWHVQKLANAYGFDPALWCYLLGESGWNPKVVSSYAEAIAAVANPTDCYLLLDPPYIEEMGNRKMSPCYPGHKVTGYDGRKYTMSLATLSVALGMDRKFPLIHLCNYWTSELDREVQKLASHYGYIVSQQTVGTCRALGNSAGRLTHGNRVDARPLSEEVVWELTCQ